MATYEINYVCRKLNDKPAPIIKTSQEAAKYLLGNCYEEKEAWREKTYAVYLDDSNRVKGHMLISVGGINATNIDKRLIAKGAIDSLARSVVLSHNHPSGNVVPSINDINVTKQLKTMLGCFDIRLLDHIIIGDEEYYSFSEEVKFKLPNNKKQ